MRHVGPSIPALLLIILVIGGALLLIAGFGVGVGIGILVGLLVGVVSVGAAFALAQRGRMASGWTKAAPGVASDEGDRLRRFGEAMSRVTDVDSGELKRVVAVGEAVETAGVSVELLSIELRADGGIATFATHTKPPVAVPGHFVEATLSDDGETVFTAAGQSTMSQSPSVSRFEVRFAPAPQGSTLKIRIERFVNPFPDSPSSLDGPWAFTVALPGDEARG